MKFKFRHEALLKHRKIKRDQARVVYESALYELKLLKEDLAKLREDISRSFRDSESAIKKGSKAFPVTIQSSQFRDGTKFLIEKKRSEIKNQKGLVEKKRQILMKLTIDYKMIDKMKMNQRADFKKLAIKKEQKFMDEVSQIMKAKVGK